MGWGQIGNQNIGNSAYLSLISGGNSRRYTIGGTVLQGYSPSSIGNPNIKWETVEQTNFGIDLELLNNKFSLIADYYVKDTKDMLLNIPLPYYSGYPSTPVSNAGSIQNKGFEFQINHRNSISGFNYDLGLNLTTVNNKVTSLGSQASIYGGTSRLGTVTKTEVGHPIGSFFGFVMDGIFQDATEVQNGHQPLAIPGDVRFKDLAGKPDVNGKPTGPDGVINEYDKTYIGSPIPDLLLGLNLNLGYKNFDLKLFFQGTFGNDIYNTSKIFTNQPMGSYNTSVNAYETAWHGAGTSNTQPIISSVNKNDNYRNSTFYVENGSYLRIKDAQIGYSIPESACKSMHLAGLRIFLSAQNLMTFTKYKGLDPEVGSNTLLDVGVDYNTYPQSRTILAGLNINF
jgi:TonB-linked SusC/RagA family outer membrane protein